MLPIGLAGPSRVTDRFPRWRLRCLVPMVRPASPPGPIGLILPTFTQDTVPAWAARPPRGSPDVGDDPIDGVVETCRRAEQLGADALWACDHLFWHGPCLESMMSWRWPQPPPSRLTLGTCVLQLPLRQAPVVAKQAATLQP